MKETSPLQWPNGQPRTPIKDRKERKVWKKTERQSIDQLNAELTRFNVMAWTLTRKDPHDVRTAPDPSITILFSRKRDDEYGWQSALGITNPAPSLDEINQAFKKIAGPHHPDRGGDIEIYHALDRHKKNAIAFVNRLSGASFDFAIACDTYKETRWNILAVANTIHSFRQMERDGTSRILEQAMEGFKPALTGGTDATVTA